jgi:predicted Zn-dependent protease
VLATGMALAIAALSPRAHAESDLLALADRLQHQHRFGAAEAVLAAHLANNPDDANTLLRRAQIRLEAGKSREALADCLRASARLSALAASACQAQAMAQLGQARRAREQIEAALAQSGDADTVATVSWATGIAAELAAQLGDTAAAEAHYRHSLATAGDAHFPRIAYAQFLLDQKRPRDALRLLASAHDDSSVRRLRRLALEMPQ